MKSHEVLPYATREARSGSRASRIALAAAFAYPLLPVVGLYTTWGVAWVVLGHRPRSSLDDPLQISAEDFA